MKILDIRDRFSRITERREELEIYLSFCLSRRKSRKLYNYHNHHVLPKCLGGSNDRENLIALTLADHTKAHELLCEVFPEHAGLADAVVLLRDGKDPDAPRKWFTQIPLSLVATDDVIAKVQKKLAQEAQRKKDAKAKQLAIKKKKAHLALEKKKREELKDQEWPMWHFKKNQFKAPTVRTDL